MIASLALTGKYSIGISQNNKIKVDGQLLSISDIPFIRYRFDKYGEEEIEFIKKNKAKFVGPIHLVEINLDENTPAIIEKLGDIENLAKFVYVPADDNAIENGFSEETKGMIAALEDSEYDRLIIKDKSTMMYPLAADRLRRQASAATDDYMEYKDIGVCGETISIRYSDTDEGLACLTAVWARKIMADYAEKADLSLPTANHEGHGEANEKHTCLSCCGCIRYFKISEDIPAPASGTGKSEAKPKNKTVKKDNDGDSGSKEKKEKVSKPKGFRDVSSIF